MGLTDGLPFLLEYMVTAVWDTLSTHRQLAARHLAFVLLLFQLAVRLCAYKSRLCLLLSLFQEAGCP